MATIVNLSPTGRLNDNDLSVVHQDNIDKKYTLSTLKSYLGIPAVGVTPYMSTLLDDQNEEIARDTLGVTYATKSEGESGTEGKKVVSPEVMQAHYEFHTADDNKTIEGLSETDHVTPKSLAAVTSTETRKGLIAKATKFEAETGEDNTKAMTPLNVNDAVATLIPTGIPMPWPTSTPPQGWKECDGTSFDKVMYPKLAIAYPSGFVPDLRGEFIRGWSHGRDSVDVGRDILTEQTDDNKNHSHSITNKVRWGNPDNNYAEPYYVRSGYSNTGDDITSTSSDGSESRPRNISFMYIVRLA